MKILLIGDTHSYLETAAQAIEKNRMVDLIIHLGDYYRDAVILSSMFPGIPLEYVYGNSDIAVGNTCAEKILEVSEKKVFITHGHRYTVEAGYDRLLQKAREIKADMVLFGHTHKAEMFKEKGIVFINPGSISSPQNTLKCTYVVINIEGRKISSKIYCIK
jgi:putative phosphoesterase